MVNTGQPTLYCKGGGRGEGGRDVLYIWNLQHFMLYYNMFFQAPLENCVNLPCLIHQKSTPKRPVKHPKIKRNNSPCEAHVHCWYEVGTNNYLINNGLVY